MTSQRVAVTPIKTSSMAPLTTAVRPFACSSVSGKDSRRDRSDRGHGGNRGQNQSHGEPARANLREDLLDHLSTENRRPLCPAIVLIGDLHVIEPSIALLLSSSFPGGSSDYYRERRSGEQRSLYTRETERQTKSRFERIYMQSTSAAPQALPPQAVIVQMVMGGWVARAISDVSRLNIPDQLKKSGPMTAAELVAGGVDANPEALQRVMRACASVGVFTEAVDGSFGLTELSDVLTADSPLSVKVIAQEIGGLWLKLWTALADAIRTGEPQARQVVGMEWWDYLKANPKEMETFGEAMNSNSLNSMRGVLDNCDFSKVKKVADIGGGFGHLVVALLEKYPNLRGVLLDMPDLIPVAKHSFAVSDPNVSSRLEYMGADMFETVPRADAYVLKHIVHDWDDERCLRLLRNCHANMDGDGRLICVDSVLPPTGDIGGTAAKFLDLLMMLAIRGKERTRKQWEELYDAAGFRIINITPLQDNFGTSIVEGVKQ